MYKCRLCLQNSKNSISIFDSYDNEISYADMVTTITNVKISKDDGITDQICLRCRRKTRLLCDFKHQVERSYVALQENCCTKRVNFSNICDVKLSIEITDNDLKKPVPVALTEKLVKNVEGSFNYNDTVIKKVPFEEKKPLSVVDFLNSIKEENDDDFCDDYSYEVEVDYDPDLKNDPDFEVKLPSNKKNSRKKLIKKDSDFTLQQMSTTNKKKDKENQTVLRTPVKPVFLADYSLVPVRRKPKEKRIRKDNLRVCPYCGKMTKSLKSHLVSHSDERPFKCDQCSRTFVLLIHLKSHQNRAHAPRNVKCDECVAVFSTKEALKNHMTSHSTVKKHACEICSKAFKLKTHVLRHVRLVHRLGAKPWKCELCPDTFNSKDGLNHHMRVHTGERPYRCEICSQPYSYKHDFNRHCLNKHGVCFKRRTVHVMNEEVLLQERILMRDLMLRVNGILKDDKPINPFEGPQAALAFDQMIKAIQSGKIVVDLQF